MAAKPKPKDDRPRCKAKTYSPSSWPRSSQCEKRASMPDGYCKTHSPAERKARDANRAPSKYDHGVSREVQGVKVERALSEVILLVRSFGAGGTISREQFRKALDAYDHERKILREKLYEVRKAEQWSAEERGY